MGQKKTDGKAIDVVAPGSTLVEKGELIRIDGWNGIAMDEITTTEVARGLAIMVSEEIWYVKTPVGVGTTRGIFLYWANPATFQTSGTHLQATPAATGQPPACKVEEVRDAAGYTAVQVLNTPDLTV